MNREPIRKAAAADASRLAEILIFTKRTHYRRIFRDDRRCRSIPWHWTIWNIRKSWRRSGCMTTGS